MGVFILLHDTVDFRAPLLDADSRPQTADHVQEVVIVAYELLRRDVLFKRHPDLYRTTWVHKPARQDADNLVVLAVEHDRASQYVRRSAEAALPKTVADQGHMRSA